MKVMKILVLFFILSTISINAMDEQSPLLKEQEKETIIHINGRKFSRAQIKQEIINNQNNIMQNLHISRQASNIEFCLAYFTISAFATGYALALADQHTAAIITLIPAVLLSIASITAKSFSDRFSSNLKKSILRQQELQRALQKD